MKNLFKVTMLAAFAMAFAACSEDATENVVPANPDLKQTITVSVDAAMTRTTLTDDKKYLQWADGDKLGFYTDQETDKNIEVAYAAGDLTLEVTAGAKEIYAYYPYSSNNSSKTADKITLGMANQTQTEGGVFHGKDYPMAAKATISDNAATLTLTPVASAIAFNVYKTEGYTTGEQVKSIKLTSEKLGGYTVYNLTTQAFPYTPSYTYLTVTLDEPVDVASAKPADAKTYDKQIYLMLHKGTYTNASLQVETTKDIYIFTGVNLDCTKDIISMNLNLSKGTVLTAKEYDVVSSLSEIDPTATYIIGGNAAKSFNSDNDLWMFTGSIDSGDAWKLSLTKTVFENNSIKNAEIANVKLESAEATDTYYIKVGENYLCNTSISTSNNDKSLVLRTTDPTPWTFSTKEGYEGFFLNSSANGSNFMLASGSAAADGLRLYSANNTSSFGIYFLREVGTGTTAITPKIAVSENTFTLPATASTEPYSTFTISGNSTADLTQVKFALDATTVAAGWLTYIYDNTTGVVTLNATANSAAATREATLTVSIDGGNSVDVTITQAAYIDENAAAYVKVTSAPADWSGKYLIVYDGKAFNGSVSSNTLQLSDITATDGKILSDDTTNAYAVVIAKNGDKYTLMFETTGKYINNSSSTSISLVDAANIADNSKWNIALDSGKTTVTISVPTNSNRFLGYNGSSGFKAYAASGNNAHPELYKYNK